MTRTRFHGDVSTCENDHWTGQAHRLSDLVEVEAAKFFPRQLVAQFQRSSLAFTQFIFSVFRSTRR